MKIRFVFKALLWLDGLKQKYRDLHWDYTNYSIYLMSVSDCQRLTFIKHENFTIYIYTIAVICAFVQILWWMKYTTMFNEIKSVFKRTSISILTRIIMSLRNSSHIVIIRLLRPKIHYNLRNTDICWIYSIYRHKENKLNCKKVINNHLSLFL